MPVLPVSPVLAQAGGRSRRLMANGDANGVNPLANAGAQQALNAQSTHAMSSAEADRQSPQDLINTSPELEDHLSRSFICPISHRIMDVPVISPSGHSYDCDSIVQWLQRRPVDPLSLQPISIERLYLNRALQDEITEQLERLAAQTEHLHLAETAHAKLQRIRDLSALPMPIGKNEDRHLEHLSCICASWASWWGLFAWEQVLVFTTSFGAIFCSLHDVRTLLLQRAAIRKPFARPPALLHAFLRLALVPGSSSPPHWHRSGRFVLAALRGALFVSVGPFILSLLLGGVFSLVQFGRRCAEVRAEEFERAMQHRWFVRALHACSAVTGICSLLLAMRLHRDYREWQWQNK